MDKIHQKIASLIFIAEQAIGLTEIVDCLSKYEEKEVTEEEVLDAIEALKAQYAGPDYGFELFEMSGGYLFMSKPEYHRLLSIYINTKQKRKLSRAAMETLAIIAYSQPISKSMMEQIRGVNCDYSVQKLLERELIEIKGRSDGPGKPLLYGVGDVFLDYFGIKSTDDLPKLKDIAPPVNEIGDPSDEEELLSSTGLIAEQNTPEGEVTVELDGQEVTVDLGKANADSNSEEAPSAEESDKSAEETKAEATALEQQRQEEEEQENDIEAESDEEAEHAAQEEHEAKLAAAQEAQLAAENAELAQELDDPEDHGPESIEMEEQEEAESEDSDEPEERGEEDTMESEEARSEESDDSDDNDREEDEQDDQDVEVQPSQLDDDASDEDQEPDEEDELADWEEDEPEA